MPNNNAPSSLEGFSAEYPDPEKPIPVSYKIQEREKYAKDPTNMTLSVSLEFDNYSGDIYMMVGGTPVLGITKEGILRRCSVKDYHTHIQVNNKGYIKLEEG